MPFTSPSSPIFTTAGSKNVIHVSDAAIEKARQCLCEPTEDRASVPLGFTGFLTAGSNKVIPVSDEALMKARIKMNEQEALSVSYSENKSDIDANRPNTSKGFEEKVKGFVSPMLSRISDVSIHSPNTLDSVANLTPKIPGKRRFSTPFKPPFISPSGQIKQESQYKESSCSITPVSTVHVNNTTPTSITYSLCKNKVTQMDLHLIGMLNDQITYATVKGYISDIKMDSITYFGCSKCKKKMLQNNIGNSYCERCSTDEGRYFYLIQAELSDFSASKWVVFFNDTAEKLIGDSADELAKVMRYQPDSLRARLFPLYFRPKLFQVTQRESKWTVYDLKEIDFAEFIPYLRSLVEKKGYRSKKPEVE